MKAVVQRVKNSSVMVEDKPVSDISNGLLVLLGVQKNDTRKDVEYLVEKIINLRIFDDDEGKMNISLKQIKGELMVVSQFTLLGDCKKGRRPSYQAAAPPQQADALYTHFADLAKQNGVITRTGIFQAMMDVSLINHGPVTLILDTNELRQKNTNET